MAINKKWLDEFAQAFYQCLNLKKMKQEIPFERKIFDKPINNIELTEEEPNGERKLKKKALLGKDFKKINPKIWFIFEHVFTSDVAILIQNKCSSVVESSSLLSNPEVLLSFSLKSLAS